MPPSLHDVNGTMLRDTLIALLAVGGLVWFIASRINQFKSWVKEELMGDAKFIAAIGAEVDKIIKAAFLDHEAREVERYEEFERRVETKLIQFASHLSIVEAKLDSKPPENH